MLRVPVRVLLHGLLGAVAVAAVAGAAFGLKPVLPILGGILRLLLHPVVLALVVAVIVLLRLRSQSAGARKSRSPDHRAP